MSYFIDISYESINKFGEELCGDSVEIIRTDDSVIAVMADGLGSGVKANILSTLTSKIAATMMKEGVDLYETVDTIAHTLPECKIRKLAYSTFTIVQIFETGIVYIAEYDNPPYFLNAGNHDINIQKKKINIDGKMISESKFTLEDGDSIVLVSDGVIHAGVGSTLNLGWQYENVKCFIEGLFKDAKFAGSISRNVIDVTRDLFDDRPGDDATVVSIMLKKEEKVNIFTGPPKLKEHDEEFVKKFMKLEGKKIICGGTAALIFERCTHEKLAVDIGTMTDHIPPVARLKGIDLVTEGVITLSKTSDKIKNYMQHPQNYEFDEIEGRDGASQMAKILIENCTCLELWVGKAVNPAHQNPDFPIDLSIKLKVVEELMSLMKTLGKKVNINYI